MRKKARSINRKNTRTCVCVCSCARVYEGRHRKRERGGSERAVGEIFEYLTTKWLNLEC